MTKGKVLLELDTGDDEELEVEKQSKKLIKRKKKEKLVNNLDFVPFL